METPAYLLTPTTLLQLPPDYQLTKFEGDHSTCDATRRTNQLHSAASSTTARPIITTITTEMARMHLVQAKNNVLIANFTQIFP